jgi:c-di-AMP phosphodiesterase-like protein
MQPMYKNVLVDKLPVGIIVTDSQYRIKYINNFVAMKISSEIPLLEQELEKLVSKKNSKKNTNLIKLCLSINTQIFRVIMMDTGIDKDLKTQVYLITIRGK